MPRTVTSGFHTSQANARVCWAKTSFCHYTRGISARSSAKGIEQVQLDEVEVRETVRSLHDAGIEALTVTMINSSANPAHEQRIKTIAEPAHSNYPSKDFLRGRLRLPE